MKNFLDYAAKKYYDGHPIITDEEFDYLAEKFNYQSVGAISSDNKITHSYRLYSLAKNAKLDAEGVIVSPKLDGAAVVLTYVNGQLKLAATRGDGYKGQDITANIQTLPSLPGEFSKGPLYQITGEVVAPKTIANARNYAAGALNLKKVEEFTSKDLQFIAYGITPYIFETWSKDMVYLQNQGFATVIDSDWSQYPQDGQVWRVDNNKKFESLGYTNHHPRGATAIKFNKAGICTTLLDVVWQVGKTGVVSPVAILEPIEIDGARITRATLHNAKYIKDLKLQLGCQVEVIRSGDIIPRVVRRV